MINRGWLAINDGYRVKLSELGSHGIPFVRGGDIGDGWISTDVEDRVLPAYHGKLGSKLTKPDDVAFITKGTVGRVGRLRSGQPPVVFAPQVCFWRSTSDANLSSAYLFYLLQSRWFQTQLNGVKTSGSMAADYVSLRDQQHFRLPIPPIDEQRRIAAVLGALDDKIELNRKMNRTLEAMAQALFKSWFIDFDGVPDSDLVESELGPIPKDWTTARLGDVCSKIGSGATPRGGSEAYVQSGISFIRSQNVYDFRFDWGGLVYIHDEEAHRLRGVTVEPRDVLINITGDSVLRTCVVDPAVLPARVNQHVAIVRPMAQWPPEVVHLQLLHPRMKAWLLGHSAGATRKAITKGHLESVPLLLPPEEILCHMGLRLRALYDKRHSNELQSRTLATLRDTLLPKLISGELRVPEAETAVEAVV